MQSTKFYKPLHYNLQNYNLKNYEYETYALMHLKLAVEQIQIC